jgi:hypothetical protein
MAAATVLTTVGKGLVTARLALNSGTLTVYTAQYIGWGTSGTTAVVGDTALGAEVTIGSGSPAYARAVGVGSQVTTSVTNDTYQIQGTITAGATLSIFECGNFDAATAGNIMVHSSFASAIPLNANDQITFKIQVQFT